MKTPIKNKIKRAKDSNNCGNISSYEVRIISYRRGKYITFQALYTSIFLPFFEVGNLHRYVYSRLAKPRAKITNQNKRTQPYQYQKGFLMYQLVSRGTQLPQSFHQSSIPVTSLYFCDRSSIDLSTEKPHPVRSTDDKQPEARIQ